MVLTQVAAAESGVSAKMIRHYESLGLMAPATRSSGRFRYYDDAEIQELRFIASGLMRVLMWENEEGRWVGVQLRKH